MRRVVKRDAEWEATKRAVRRRSGGRCEVTLLVGHELVRCRHAAVDPHHTTKRSRGGKRTKAERNRPEVVIDICRPHHDLTDMDYAHGKLIIRPLGDGQFACRFVFAADKFAAREASAE